MAKISRIFKTDAALVPTFIALVVTGIGIHIASENSNHASWHTWSAAHVIIGLAFLILIYFHIRQHIGWYKTLLRGSAKGRRGATIVLTVVMLLETLSGIALIGFVDGEGSGLGHFHWVVGLILAIIGTGHFIKRFGRLRKGLGLRP